MAFAPQFLEELRSRVSLASVVSRHVRLTRRGKEYVGLCPFHKEKTPSFNVVEDKHFYHCFGCGAHGDIVGFTMRITNLSFREAVEQLAREAGIRVPIDSPHERERQARAASFHDACEAACNFFQSQLTGRGGKQALDYLARRGIDANAIERFRLGWAPDARGALKSQLVPKLSEELLITAGLLRRPEQGESFDFFRGRVIFPISDRAGKVIGFGGRILGDGQPKYLNSPDTPIFDKGRTLYGLHIARSATKSEWPPIVVEGYTDVIGLHLAGFTRAVAPLGTALSESQLVELWGIAPEPVICFDGDAAGQRATHRALDVALPLLRPEMSLKFVKLPEKDDPDSFIRANGSAAFAGYLNSALPVSEFLWRTATGGREATAFSTPEKISQLEARLKNKIEKIDNRVVQNNYQHFIWDRIWEIRRRIRRARDLKKDKISPQLLALVRDGRTGIETRERDIEIILISMAVTYPEIALKDIDSFAALEVRNREIRDVWQAILEAFDGNNQPDSGHLISILDERYRDILERLFHSQAFKGRSFAHYGAEPEWARKGWNAMVKKARLPKLKEELEEAIEKWVKNSTDENLSTVLFYREIVAVHETEEDYVQAHWQGLAPSRGAPTLH